MCHPLVLGWFILPTKCFGNVAGTLLLLQCDNFPTAHSNLGIISTDSLAVFQGSAKKGLSKVVEMACFPQFSCQSSSPPQHIFLERKA